jgi:hypothetical protein
LVAADAAGTWLPGDLTVTRLATFDQALAKLHADVADLIPAS